MIVGDTRNIAFECVFSSGDPAFGNVFVHVDGVRFGNVKYEYELVSVFKEFDTVFNLKLKKDFSCDISAGDMLKSVLEIFSDDPQEKLCPAANYIPGFWDDPAYVIDQVVISGITYAFDQHLVLCYRSDDSVIFAVHDFEAGINSEVVLMHTEFQSLIKRFLETSRNRQRMAGKF